MRRIRRDGRTHNPERDRRADIITRLMERLRPYVELHDIKMRNTRGKFRRRDFLLLVADRIYLEYGLITNEPGDHDENNDDDRRYRRHRLP